MRRPRPDETADAVLAIRPFRDADEAAVVALWSEVFSDDPVRNEPLAVLRRKREVQPELLLLGTLDGELAATVIGGYDGYRGWVYHLAVSPQHRRAGLGRSMMTEIESRLSALGCIKVNLQVRETNLEVVEFYRSLGYSLEANVSMGRLLV